MYFTLMVPNSTMEVQIGSEEVFARSGFRLKIGKMVTVVGMPWFRTSKHCAVARGCSGSRRLTALIALWIARKSPGIRLISVF
jgi:hypothetical protein